MTKLIIINNRLTINDENMIALCIILSFTGR